MNLGASLSQNTKQRRLVGQFGMAISATILGWLLIGSTAFAYLPPPTYTDTIAGVFLYGESHIGFYPTAWHGGGTSASDATISNIEITNVGRQFCNGVTTQNWSDWDGSSPGSLAQASGASAIDLGCTIRHCYQVVSSHVFQNPTFGSFPQTGRGDDFALC